MIGIDNLGLEYDLFAIFFSVLAFVGFFVADSFFRVVGLVFISQVVRPFFFMFVPTVIFLVARFVTVIALNVIPMQTIMSGMGGFLTKSACHLALFPL